MTVVNSIPAKTQNTENSTLQGFELHTPSSKGAELLFQVIEAIINKYSCETSEFLCSQLPLLEGVQQPKKSPKKHGNALTDALLMSHFKNFAAGAARHKPHCARILEIALRAVLTHSCMNHQLIRGQRF